jgi:hypothetical protein
LSAWSSLIHARDMVLRMWIIEARIVTVIDIAFIVILPTLVFLLANTMHARARVDGVVYCPIMTLPTIGERSSHFFEAGVQGEVVADGVLEEEFISAGQQCCERPSMLTFQPEGAVLKYGNCKQMTTSEQHSRVNVKY